MPRNVRVDDELWSAALAKARAEGTTLTAVITSALRSFAEGAPAVTRPEAVAGVRATVTAAGQRAEFGAAIAAERQQRPARPRCPHPGTRTVGGWCGQCGVVVGAGGYLPDSNA